MTPPDAEMIDPAYAAETTRLCIEHFESQGREHPVPCHTCRVPTWRADAAREDQR